MNIIIVDDEIAICETLGKYVERYYKQHNSEHKVNIIKFENELKLFDYMESGYKADLIFMDIELKRLNGIDIAAKLQKADDSLQIVFITGFIDYAKSIFDAKPVYFLVKPISYEDIRKVLEKLEEDYFETERDVIAFKVDSVIHCINKKDIYYIEADGRYIQIHTKDNTYRIIGNISVYLEKMADNMVMCHRSYIVNPDKIERVDKYEVVLISGEAVPLSRRKREGLEKRLLM